MDLRELHLDGERARATWVLSGTYTGKLGVKARRVSFAIVVTYRLQGGLIHEMLVSWDALALMRQIGLFSIKDKDAHRKRVKTTSALSDEALQDQQLACVKDLALLFSLPSYPSAKGTMLQIAQRIFDVNCVFQDSYVGGEFRGLEECCNYALKVRKPFPQLSVVDCKQSSNEGAALGSPLRLDWTIKAVYKGPAAPKPTECVFTAVVFVTFDDTKIDTVHFSWNAPQLLAQLRAQ